MNRGYSEKRKLNIIDILIIAGVLLVALALIFRVQLLSLFDDGRIKTEYYVTFEADEVRNEATEQVSKLSKVEWVEKGAWLGRLDEFEISPSKIYTEQSNGRLEITESMDYSKVTGRVSVSAVSNEGCYIDGKYFLAAGMEITVRTEISEFKIIITSVTEAK